VQTHIDEQTNKFFPVNEQNIFYNICQKYLNNSTDQYYRNSKCVIRNSKCVIVMCYVLTAIFQVECLQSGF